MERGQGGVDVRERLMDFGRDAERTIHNWSKLEELVDGEAASDSNLRRISTAGYCQKQIMEMLRMSSRQLVLALTRSNRQ